MDLLTSPLATEWQGHPLHTDFRHMVRYANALVRTRADQALPIMLAAANDLFGDTGPSDLQMRLAGLSWFFTGGDKDPALRDAQAAANAAAAPAVLTLDYHADAPYIVAAFQQVYGLDLTSVELHWWRFRALLEGLPEFCVLSRIRAIRGEDVTKIRDDSTRERYIALQEQLALPKDVQQGGVMVAQTVADHDAAFLARFQH